MKFTKLVWYFGTLAEWRISVVGLLTAITCGSVVFITNAILNPIQSMNR